MRWNRIVPRLLVAGVSLALYAWSCRAPALHFVLRSGPIKVWPGWEVALMGWGGLLVGNLGWVANWPYAVSVVLILAGMWRPAAAASFISVLLSLHSLKLIGVPIHVNQGGNDPMVLTRFETGFCLWLGALVLALIGSLGGMLATRKSP